MRAKLTRQRTIELGVRTASVGDRLYAPLPMAAALRALARLARALPRPDEGRRPALDGVIPARANQGA